MLNQFSTNISDKFHESPSLLTLRDNQELIQTTLEKISSQSTLVHKAVEDYIESKRLAFPRFFFMTDKQFLDFIDLAE
jgi:hypothetical protein